MNLNKENHNLISIRPPAVAGSFYPQDRAELDTLLKQLLAASTTSMDAPKAIIAPHAGYRYSGPIAAKLYAPLEKLKEQIKRVVLLGPAHRKYIGGIALPTHTHFASPLGNVQLDTGLLAQLEQQHPDINYDDAAHQQEHSLEVHLPFLQSILNDFQLVPLLVGDATAELTAHIIETLWGGSETLIVVSSDLSHFHEYDVASKIDRGTTKLIETFAYDSIGPEQACGCMPLRGLLMLAQKHSLQLETIAVCNSGDTAGSKDRVVGYGAYALYEQTRLDEGEKEIVFEVIQQSILSGLTQQAPFDPVTANYSFRLQQPLAVFVTLKLNGELRGCIGTTEARMPLINAVAHYAYAAAFNDPRFNPLTQNEFDKITINLSVLTPRVPLTFNDEADLIAQLRPQQDGLIIEHGQQRATFLPSVWELIEDKETFFAQLKLKAGIAIKQTPEKAWRYTADYYC